MRHGRLHPDAEDVQLEQAQVLHVVLVELAHGVAAEAGLQRGALPERRVAEDHAAGVQRDVPGQAVEGFHQGEQHVEALLPQTRGAQLRQVAQRGAGVSGADVREGLGHGVHLHGRQAERGPDVADRVPHPVGLDHGHARHALPAERGQDLVVDLGAAGRFHVQIDVRQRHPQRGEEPLHDQAVPDGVHAGDPEGVVDQAAGAGSAGRAADAEAPDEAHDVCHREEVGLEAQPADHRQLVVEAAGDLRGEGAVALGQAGLTPGAQHRRRQLDRGAERLELGQPDLPQADVSDGVQPAALGQVPGGAQQRRPVRLPREAGGLVRRGPHALLRFQVSLRVAPVDGAHVQRGQPAGGVEHVRGGGLLPPRHPHRVGEHDGDREPARQPDGARGLVRRPRPAATRLMIGGGQHQPRAQLGAPPSDGGLRQVRAVRGEGLAHLRVRAEQHHRVPSGAVPHDELERDRGIPALSGELRGGDEFTQRGPPWPRGGQDDGAREPLVAQLPAAGGGGAPVGAPAVRPDREVHPDDGRDPRLQAGLREPHRPVEAAAVCDGERVHAVAHRLGHELAGVGGAVLEGVARRHPQVDEAVHHDAFAAACRRPVC